MARKHYDEEFRRNAVDLYETTPGATVRSIAGDLGIERGTLRGWLDKYGTGRKTGADGTPTTSPLHRRTTDEVPDGETPEEELVRLRARVRALEVETTKLTTEREILRKAAKYFAGGDELVSRFQFVADNSATYPVKWLCDLLEVVRSSYYAWRKAAPGRERRAATDDALLKEITAVHDEDTSYGAPRITADLNDGKPAGERVNHKRVERVMREHGIAGYRKRRRVKTTVPEPAEQKYPDQVKRDFTAPAPNKVYVGDITYLPLAIPGIDGKAKNLYLATVIDCFSRRLVGWAIADHMRIELVIDALRAAERDRGSLRGAIFHSDHGSVYTSKDFADACQDMGVTQSMGAVGTSADNALAESFNAAFKREVLRDSASWPDERTCRRQAFRWLTRYNTRRRHSFCNNMSPNDYERSVSDRIGDAA
ncbi:IS3 family transposase [Gordonia phthalatica]|uniref:IS3 family transposase n=1 Tax=Gordonia TaxID=2053 RepID=UPI003AAF5917